MEERGTEIKQQEKTLQVSSIKRSFFFAFKIPLKQNKTHTQKKGGCRGEIIETFPKQAAHQRDLDSWTQGLHHVRETQPRRPSQRVIEAQPKQVFGDCP